MPTLLFSQDELKGMVMEANENNEHIPLPEANVFWLDTTVGASTDLDGMFTIPYKKDYKKLVISYVGFTTDTLDVADNKMLQHWLKPTSNLDEVVCHIFTFLHCICIKLTIHTYIIIIFKYIQSFIIYF